MAGILGFEPRMPDSESGALPLGDIPMYGDLYSKKNISGFIRYRCHLAWRYPNVYMQRSPIIGQIIFFSSFLFSFSRISARVNIHSSSPIPVCNSSLDSCWLLSESLFCGIDIISITSRVTSIGHNAISAEMVLSLPLFSLGCS